MNTTMAPSMRWLELEKVDCTAETITRQGQEFLSDTETNLYQFGQSFRALVEQRLEETTTNGVDNIKTIRR